MRRQATAVALTALLLLLPGPVAAQGIGIAAKASTTGLGGDVAITFLPRVNLRAGLGFFPIEPTSTFSGIDYTITFPSPQVMATLDLFPTGGSFRLSGGVLVKSSDIEIDGDPEGTVTIGETEYDASEVGTLHGVVGTKNLAPYAGVGFGNHTSTGVGLVIDVGAAFQGEPRVDLSADGPAASRQEFQESLVREARNAEDDLGTFFKAYPVVALGLKIGVGG